MEPAANGFCRRSRGNFCCVSTGAWPGRRDTRASDTRRHHRHDFSFISDCFYHDTDGRRAFARSHFWLLGDLSGTTSRLLGVALVGAAIGVGILVMNARSLNLMMLGERDAFDLGVEVGRVRLTVFVAASLLVGASVASGGSVGYVGLVVPHLVRLSFGS